MNRSEITWIAFPEIAFPCNNIARKIDDISAFPDIFSENNKVYQIVIGNLYKQRNCTEDFYDLLFIIYLFNYFI